MTGGRRGAGLADTLVALLLTLGLLGVVGTLLVREHRVATFLIRRVEWLEAARVGRDLVGLGLAGDPRARPSEGELPVRTFIGGGAWCGDDAWRLSGRRRPDPERDSLWVVDGGGRVRAADLRAVVAATCADGLEGTALDADPPLTPDARVVRVFERGLWRVDDAVRYRRGAGGAQPLTAPVLDPRASGLRVAPDGVGLQVSPGGGAPALGRRWRRP